MKTSTHKQFFQDAQYWIEIRHIDHCAYCRESGQDRKDCATSPAVLNQRIRVAQFIYFMEAIDYAQGLQKHGVQSWLRKPRFVGQNGIESDYSHYPVKDGKPDGLLQTPVVPDGNPGMPAL